jgi:hypothetical protein
MYTVIPTLAGFVGNLVLTYSCFGENPGIEQKYTVLLIAVT